MQWKFLRAFHTVSLKCSLFFFLVLNLSSGFSQSLPDSLCGKYVYTNWIGGGFAGDGNGNCYAVPIEATIEHTIIIDSEMNIVKIVDTTGNVTASYASLFDCDTLYFGKVEFVDDTLIATYTKKPICPFFTVAFSLDGDEQSSEKEELIRYEELEIPFIEKYQINLIDNQLFSITPIDESGNWPEEYRKVDSSEL